MSPRAAVQTWHWHYRLIIFVKDIQWKQGREGGWNPWQAALYGPQCLHRTYLRKLQQLGMFVQLPASSMHANIQTIHAHSIETLYTVHTRWIQHSKYRHIFHKDRVDNSDFKKDKINLNLTWSSRYDWQRSKSLSWQLEEACCAKYPMVNIYYQQISEVHITLHCHYKSWENTCLNTSDKKEMNQMWQRKVPFEVDRGWHDQSNMSDSTASHNTDIFAMLSRMF